MRSRSKAVVRKLAQRHGKRFLPDIERGVAACEKVWDFDRRPVSEFERFCLEQYAKPGKGRQQLLERLDEFHHGVAGNLAASYRISRAGQDIADRPLLAAESVFSAFAPDTHLGQDYRQHLVAAVAQLNFGTGERRPPRNRLGWASRRLGLIGRRVIPSDLLAAQAEAQSQVDRFISGYNLHLDRFDFGDSRVRFPKGTKLVSHWGLRDYMMEQNGKPNALPKQRAILGLMRRVVDGEIPEEVLDNPDVEWNLDTGKLRKNGRWSPARGHGPLRWNYFRGVWRQILQIDPHRLYGNLIEEKFLYEREMPEDKIVGILTDIISSPLAKRVAAYVSDQLGRKLEPFDIYYRDFAGQGVGKQRLQYDIRKRYRDSEALQQAIPDILVKLGWKRDRARWIGSRIRVDNGRSAGHAWPPSTDTDLQLLRVRVDSRGCSEMSFETFMHELGHCVEGVLSSYELDYKILWGVPNTSFTEGFAFTFQDRTDEVLGRKQKSASDVTTLLRFWEPFEIAGSALTEIRFFHWLYENRDATPREMMHAIRRIGDEIWKDHYAAIFGPESHGLLSVYSHILWGDFYLAEYPIGYVIAYQVRKHLRGKSLSREMERMCALGSIYPDSWMRAAVGQGVSVKPLLDDTRRALERLGY